MKNILIPTDFSENAWNAIDYALQFFSKTPCNIYLLHVNKPDVMSSSENLFTSNKNNSSNILVKPSKQRLQELLNRVKKNFPDNTNHKFFTISDTNYIIDSIRKQVLERKIHLIVMGTKGNSGLKNFCIGSNAGNVITKVKCTTMVVPENARFIATKEIAFPTDFSIFYQAETLQPLVDVVEMFNATVRVLHVNKSGSELNEDQQRNKEYLDDYFANYKHSYEFLTNKFFEDAVQKFVDSKEINLITMLAKNLNYFQKILFHPTIKGISYYKDIPFLVLH
ncbi:universal stress protein [Mariniflexile jejuense]|uniref:Universal stress protein n=1 Tax=Mariniflexile jejuense TaxID=1173582 RepID=A0ABW3JJU1_9FLAO